MIPRAELVAHWPVAALLCPLVFAAIAPVAITTMPFDQFVTLAQLPLYMAHQAEEHANDRFRRFVNARLGSEALSPGAVAVINLPGVWGVILAALLLGVFVDRGVLLAAAYLSIVNAALHMAAAVALRAYNPGLVTAILLLLPGGIAGLWVVGALPGVGPLHHALALGIAIGIHAAIILHVRLRAAAHG